jgi:hypothetical protein
MAEEVAKPGEAGAGGAPVEPPKAPEGGKQPTLPGITPEGAKTEGAPSTPEIDGDLTEGVIEKGGKKFIHLPESKFKDRVAKATRKELRETFGTSDVKEILRWKKQLDEMQAEADKRRREEMTEREKLEEDKKQLTTRAEQAERRAERAQQRVAVEKYERIVTRAAREHVRSDLVDLVTNQFASQMRSSSAAKQFLGKEGEWFKEFAEKNPEFARGAKPVRESSAQPPAPERKPANNGNPPPTTKPAAPKGIPPHLQGKTPKPGQPNSMTTQEVAEYARAVAPGLNWPGAAG